MRNFWTKQIATAFMFGCMASTAFAGTWTVVQTSADAKYTTDRSNWKQITPGMVLPDNSWVNTGKRGRLTIQKDTNVVNLNPGTLAGINELGGNLDKTVIAQQTGSVTLDLVHKSAPWMTVQTPFLAAVVKGTKFSVTIGKTDAIVDVSRGRVGVTDPRRGETVDIVTGQKAQVDATSAHPMKVAGAGKIEPVRSVQPTAPVLPMTSEQSQAVKAERQKSGVDATDENKKPEQKAENQNNNSDNTNQNDNQNENQNQNQNQDRYQNRNQNNNQNENNNQNDNNNQNQNKYQKQSYNNQEVPNFQATSQSDIGYSKVPMSGFKNRSKTSSKSGGNSTKSQKQSSATSSTLSHSTGGDRPVTTLLNTLFGSAVIQPDVVQTPSPSPSTTSTPQPQVQSSSEQGNGGSQPQVQTSSDQGNGGSQSQTASGDGNSGTDQTKVSSTTNSNSNASSTNSKDAKIRQILKRAFPKMRF